MSVAPNQDDCSTKERCGFWLFGCLCDHAQSWDCFQRLGELLRGFLGEWASIPVPNELQDSVRVLGTSLLLIGQASSHSLRTKEGGYLRVLRTVEERLFFWVQFTVTDLGTGDLLGEKDRGVAEEFLLLAFRVGSDVDVHDIAIFDLDVGALGLHVEVIIIICISLGSLGLRFNHLGSVLGCWIEVLILGIFHSWNEWCS